MRSVGCTYVSRLRFRATTISEWHNDAQFVAAFSWQGVKPDATSISRSEQSL